MSPSGHNDAGETASASEDDGDLDPQADTGGDDSSSDDDQDDTAGAGTTGSNPIPPSAGFATCPDPLPPDWLLCEDFERLEDPSKRFFEYQDGDGAFVVGVGDAASGERSMRTTYRAGVEGAGWLSAAIGDNPAVYADVPNVAPSERFDAIYWRFRVKTQAGWPDAGLGHLSSASIFASAEWTQAMVARLRSDDDDGTLLRAEALSCIDGDAITCHGFEDAARQTLLGGFVGDTPIFSEPDADTWRCVEAHVVLNTPGARDGVFEFWVDGALESGTYDLDWRGQWAEFGINLVTLENLWPGGAHVDLERAVDDFVISTAPIGCE